MEPYVGKKSDNLKKSIEMITEAASNGANLIVLPELCNSGYVFETREEAFALSENIPLGESCKSWSNVCEKLGVHIVAGINERSGDLLYNSSVVLGPNGYVGTFRKIHLWNEENLFFEPGDLGFPVFKTPIGRISCHICYDSWFPESFRLAALQGADIVCVSTNWVPIPGQEKNREAMANILVMGAAHVNSIFIAAADRIGTERGQPFIGQSIIANYTGWPIGGPASKDKEEIIYAEANLSDARRKRNWNEYNQPLRDRRKDVYGEMLGSQQTAGWY
ncbi:MAG: nitrilase family protein [Alphaproteobacteria bacterium]|nr:nitrilase family protein [Alphaproteobacteria bacterium]